MDTRPTIHVHGGFRTGSTVVWAAIKGKNRNSAFYEPLHEDLDSIQMSSNHSLDVSIKDDIGTEFEDDLFGCFQPLLNPMNGVRGFRRSFSYEHYFATPNEPNHRLLSYLNSIELLARAKGTRPVLNYVRSQGRVGWIRNACGGVHLGIVRRCADQFRSYMWNAENGNFYFLSVVCEIFAKNVSLYDSELAAKLLKLEAYYSPNAGEERLHYIGVANRLSIFQLYFAHCYLWKRQFRHTLEESDAVFSINASAETIRELNVLLSDYDFELDLSKVRPSKIDDVPALAERFKRIEALADYCLWHAGHARTLKNKRSAVRFLDDALEQEALAAEKLAVAGPFASYSPMEMVSALGSSAPQECSNSTVSESLFGRYSPPPMLLTVPHRLTGDCDELLRVDARAMYIGPGAALRRDPVTQMLAIGTSRKERSLVAFGPHWQLPAGQYELTITYDASPLSGTVDGEVSLSVVSDYGKKKSVEDHALPLSGWSVETLTFQSDTSLDAFEIRVEAVAATVCIFGYTVLRIGSA